MQNVHDRNHLARAMDELSGFGSLGREGGLSAERPVLIDRFLASATEVDVDAIRDATGDVLIGGVMEHVEEAGVHSGDSSCALPPVGVAADVLSECTEVVRRLAPALGVVGLINVQLALHDGRLHVLEVNPRASRTVPVASKARGVNLVDAACRLVAAVVAALVALGSNVFVFRPLEKRSPSMYTMLLASFAVGLILRYILFLLVDRFDLFDKRIQIPLEIWYRNPSLILTNVFFWVVPTTIGLVLVLTVLLNYTALGREMRALARRFAKLARRTPPVDRTPVWIACPAPWASIPMSRSSCGRRRSERM